MKICFNISGEEIRKVCLGTQDYLASLAIGENEIQDMVMALDEVLTNIYEHGYTNSNSSEKKVGIEIFISDDRVYFVVTDCARHYTLEEKSVTKNIQDYLKSTVIGGFGISIIKKLMDQVTLFPLFEENVFIMAKNLRTKDISICP